ncbi:hypothetical protein WMY96_19265 [Vibrio diabolicus]|nr:hypothetical protein [Vibrio parahaemolyticus]
MENVIKIIKSELVDGLYEEQVAFGTYLNEKDNSKKILTCGSVYGFFVRLNNKQLNDLISEAKNKLTLKNSVGDIKPIFDDVYVLYWGKDKSIGARLNAHIQNKSKGTSILRLCAYKSLENIKIGCYNIVVSNHDEFEVYLQKTYKQILKTTKQIL